MALQAGRVALANVRPYGPAGGAEKREYLTLARLWLAEGKPSQANGPLARPLQAARGAGRLGSAIEILVSHTLNIYSRLDAHSHREALADAARLGILPNAKRLFRLDDA